MNLSDYIQTIHDEIDHNIFVSFWNNDIDQLSDIRDSIRYTLSLEIS